MTAIFPESTLALIVLLETAALAAFCAYRRASTPAGEPRLYYAVFFSLLGLFAASQLSANRPVLSPDLLPPGSLGARWLNLDIAPGLRRLIEPGFWLLIAMLLVAPKTGRRAIWGIVSATAFIAAHGLELAFLLRPGSASHPELHSTLIQFGLISCFGFLLPFRGENPPRRTRVVVASMLLCTSVVFSFTSPWTKYESPLIAAAHYYSWFPENWKAGFAGEHFVPPVLPALGKYQSGSDQVFATHLDWARKAGLNVLIFDWWPKNPAVRKRIDAQVAQLERDPQVRFAIHYETLALRENGELAVKNEESNTIYMTPERRARLARHWELLVQRYLTHPSYLRIDGRPVLFIYATRHVVGPVAEAVREAREHVRRVTGVDLYLVADEVYFNVLDFDEKHGVHLLPAGRPNWERMSAFDAITCYNPYDASRKEHAGTSGADRYLSDVSDLFRRYRSYAATLGIPFFPVALPGYNDRGVRLSANHFVVPRHFHGRSFFRESLDRWVKPFLNGARARMAVVTSFNEWNESTQIEPAAPSPATTQDVSGNALYTQGESFGGYDHEHVDDLAKFLKSQ